MLALRKENTIPSDQAEADFSQTFVRNNEHIREKINQFCKEVINSQADNSDISSQALTRHFIAEKVSTKYPQFSYGIVRAIIDQIIEEIVATLVTGRNVDLKNFGSFSVRSKKARPGRNLITNEYTEVSARRVVTFKASKIMRFSVQSNKALTELHPLKSRPRVARPSAKSKNLARGT